MRRGGYWAELGIDPTDDARTIKRAYAGRLKQIDMDADPAAYIALREARDAALAAAEAGLIDVGGDGGDGEAPGDQAEAAARFDPAMLATLPPIVVVSGFGAPVVLPAYGWATEGLHVPSPVAPPDGEWQFARESTARPAAEATPTPLGERMRLTAPTVDPIGLAPGDIVIAAREPGTDYQAHYDALIAILRPSEESHPPADFAEQSAMQHHFHVLLADPRMQEIGFFAEAERWFAGMIARTAPRSDALLEIAADHFGWSEEADRVDQSAEIAWNIARRRTLRFRGEVSQRGHPNHREWRELTTSANEHSKRGRGLKRNQVRQFLATIRRDHPSLESEFDWYRVAMWEREAPKAGKLGVAGVIVYLVLTVIRIAAGDTSHPSTQQPSAPVSQPIAVTPGPQGLTEPSSDIDFALEKNVGSALDAETVRKENPRLYALFDALWTDAEAGQQSRESFADDAANLIFGRLQSDLAKAPYPLVADYRRLSLERLKRARAAGWDICDDVMHGQLNVTFSLPSDFEQRRLQNVAQILLKADDGRPLTRRSGSFTIPGKVMDDAAKGADLDRKTLGDALNGRATSKERCNARIALIEAALALPRKEGLPLLRTM